MLIIVVAWPKGVCLVGLVFIWFSFVWLVGFNVVFGLMLILVDWWLVIVGLNVTCYWFWFGCVTRTVGGFLDMLVA